MKAIKFAIWFLAFIMVAMVSSYLYQFGFSEDVDDWGTFGDYLSGIFAVFNLGVVVLLTLYVQAIENKRKEDESKFQAERLSIEKDYYEKMLKYEMDEHSKRLEKQLEYEKKMIITKLNLDYLNSLEVTIGEIYFCKDLGSLIEILKGTVVKMISFRNIINEETYKKFSDAEKKLIDVLSLLNKANKAEELKESRQSLREASTEFISKARESILSDLSISGDRELKN